MRENDFNLINERWIRVRTNGGDLDELCLLELFEKADRCQALSGELPTQDVAILRLLLAVLHTVFSRVDPENGNDAPLWKLNATVALYRWRSLWKSGKFPMEPIKKYLKSVEDRFWLFDPVHPFYQHPKAKEIYRDKHKNEIQNKASKLNSAVNKSGNKARIFLERYGEDLNTLTYPEAARWLIHLNGFDDQSLKPTFRCKPDREKLSVGRLGRLGLVYAEGDNLFETLMLNLVMKPFGDDGRFKREKPIWEKVPLPDNEDDCSISPWQELEKVSWPDNMAEFLTFPFRYIMLERENNRVNGYYIASGPCIDLSIPMEQMTCIDYQKTSFTPKRHEKNVFLWQEFDSLLLMNRDSRDGCPKVIHWINGLQDPIRGALDEDKFVRLRSVAIIYGEQQSSIEEITEDQLDLHMNLIFDLGQKWRNQISAELKFALDAAWAVGSLARDLCVAETGGIETDQNGKLKKDKYGYKYSGKAKKEQERGETQFYRAMDIPFRSWLRTISAKDSDMAEKCAKWRETVRKIAEKIGEEFVRQAGPAAYRGRIFKTAGSGSVGSKIYAAAELYNRFQASLYKLDERR